MDLEEVLNKFKEYEKKISQYEEMVKYRDKDYLKLDMTLRERNRDNEKKDEVIKQLKEENNNLKKQFKEYLDLPNEEKLRIQEKKYHNVGYLNKKRFI